MLVLCTSVSIVSAVSASELHCKPPSDLFFFVCGDALVMQLCIQALCTSDWIVSVVSS